MSVDESWEARVCMRVFLTIMSWSNEDECWWELRSESLYESFFNCHVLVKRGWELRSESLHESFLNYHVLVKRGWELMRVEKREFLWEFSQLSCPGQTRMRVDESWKARVCMRVFSTVMSSNEDESWRELRNESLYESFLNYHVLVKRGWELRSEFVWEFSQLSCPGETRMRVDEIWEVRVCMRVFSTIMSWSNEDESSLVRSSFFFYPLQINLRYRWFQRAKLSRERRTIWHHCWRMDRNPTNQKQACLFVLSSYRTLYLHCWRIRRPLCAFLVWNIRHRSGDLESSPRFAHPPYEWNSSTLFRGVVRIWRRVRQRASRDCWML